MVLTYSQPHNLSQLHDELLAAIPSLAPLDGVPRLRVEGIRDNPDGISLAVPSDAETTAIDAAVAAHVPVVEAERRAPLDNLAARVTAKEAITTKLTSDAKLARALVSVLIDELNDARAWITSFKAEVAAATTLADLKTRVASLPAMPARTLAQAKTAIANKIDGGSVD
jgi:hypothetical protein